ncbi:MAG: helix-turn-helix transcriptional regulator [Pseudomonadales bacterium]|nr:helix-turn-helix transcriptional regulator [Pseudomonadales bacterium]
MKEIKKAKRVPSAYRKLEDVIGCKWSVSVLIAVGEGVNRPGALERHIAGISKKVLSERLRKLTGFGLLEKHSYAEVPPRTEYSLTQYGHRVVQIITEIQALDAELANGHTGMVKD